MNMLDDNGNHEWIDTPTAASSPLIKRCLKLGEQSAEKQMIPFKLMADGFKTSGANRFLFTPLITILFLLGVSCNPQDLTRLPPAQNDWNLAVSDHAYDYRISGSMGFSSIKQYFSEAPFNYSMLSVPFGGVSDKSIDVSNASTFYQTAGDFLSDLITNNNTWLNSQFDDGKDHGFDYTTISNNNTSFIVGVGPSINPQHYLGATVPKGSLIITGYAQYAVSFVFTDVVNGIVSAIDPNNIRMYTDIAMSYAVLHELGHNRGLNSSDDDLNALHCPIGSNTNCVMRPFNYDNGEYTGRLIFCDRHAGILAHCLKTSILPTYDPTCAQSYECQ